MPEPDTDYSGKLTNLSCLSDTFHDLLRNGAVDSDEESPSIFEDQATHQVPGTQQKTCLHFSR